MRINKSTAILLLVLTTGGVLIFSQRYIFKILNYLSNTELGGELGFFILFTVITISARALYKFLQDSENSTNLFKVFDLAVSGLPSHISLQGIKAESNSNMHEHVADEIRKHDLLIRKHIQDSITSENISESFKELHKEKLMQLTTDDIIALVKEKYSANIIKADFQKDIDADRFLSSQRLESQINTTNRSASINLLVGAFTTLAAVSILYTTILKANAHEFHNIQEFVGYIPRITLSIFIEVFSFFFLKLYRKNLDDIKYLYNERTNIELKFLAHKTAIHKDDNELIKIIVEEFSKTERNFILKQGETTIDSERLKTENDERNKIIEAVASILRKPIDNK